MLTPINSIKKTTYNENTDEIVNKLFKGEFFFFNGLETAHFNKKIDWNYQHHQSPNTYQVYLQSIDIISHLCNYYEKKDDIKALKKAYKILLDWVKYNKKDETNPMKWRDHPTASRALNIIYLFNVSRNTIKIDEKLIYNLLEEHAEFLYNDKNYNKNNHGIMVDRALIFISLVLSTHPKSQQWQDKAFSRLREAFNRDFSYKGVHLENSPDYHSIVRRLFRSTEDSLQKNNLTLGKEITERLALTEKYFQLILKPNKGLPAIGDTTASIMKSAKLYDPPFFVDEEAGIAILQDKDESSPLNSTWISFISGYGRKTHKHRDDLSFNLYYKGNDIFVDSGKYNYVRKDKYRKYIVSPFAHNTVAIEGMDYKLLDPLKGRDIIKITGYTSNPIFDMVKGINNAYTDTKIERTLLFFKPDILIIFDKMESELERNFKQIFNLAHTSEILSKSNDLAKIKAGEETIDIVQVLGADNIESFAGDRETPRAILSERFGKLIDNAQLEFSKKGMEVHYLTVIKMGANNNRLNDISFDRTSQILDIEIDDKKLSLPL